MKKNRIYGLMEKFGLFKMIKIMRFTIFILFISLSQTFALNSYSQQAKLSLDMRNVRVEDVIDKIEKNSEFFFMYNKSMIDVDRKVDIHVEGKSVNEVLDKIFANTGITYSIKDRQILLINNRLVNTGNESIDQQQKTVYGRVTDSSGASLPGVSVSVKGTTNGMITDTDGKYTLTKVPENATLQFSFVGMRTQEIAVGNKAEINVSLADETFGLEEVVAVGYGIQKKVNLTGSVAVVGAKSLESRPVTNITTALQGLIPGATIVQNSGQPGKDMGSIRIRGIGTLNNSNPMYVVDGMVVTSMNDIDPNDIESISILKDAASAAIYGSRASNGVVLITTKKGNNKQATLKYDGYFGVQNPTNLLEYLPSWEYAQLYNKARINQGQEAAYTPEQVEKFKDGSDPDNFPNTDWLGLFYKKNGGVQQSHRAELSGGSNNTTYMFSLGYFDQDGIIKNSGFKRYNARTNVTTKFDKITASLNLAFTYGKTTEPTNPYTKDMYQIFRQINRIAPFVPYKYSNGYYGYINDGNPLAWMDLGAIRNEQYRKTRGIGNVTYEPLKGLKFQEVLGYEYTGSSDEKFVKDIQYYNWKTESPTLYQGPNEQTDTRTDNQMVSLQSLITYEKAIGKHNITALAGFSQEQSRTDWNSSYRKGFLSNDLWEINAGSTDGQEAGGSAYEYSLRSYFGRISYDFDNKYLLEANIRRDGTSRISSEARWGTFPSFSAAWRIINEPFMENIKNVVSDLKIRAGWGILGNQNIGNYPYQAVLSAANYDFGGKVNQGVGLVDGVNKDIKWESSETKNIGIDLALFSNKISFSTDLYSRRTYDILLQLPVPTPLGLSSPYQNAGEVMNKGIELQLGYKFTTGGWNFDVLANASYNKNEITNLNNDGARIWDGFGFMQEGYPINSFGGYVAEGLFRTNEDLNNSAVPNRSRAALGDIKYQDQLTIDTDADGVADKADGIINAEDRVFLGSWTPAWTFGSTFDATWKGFNIQLFFQGAAKVKGYMQLESVGQLQGNTSKPTTIFRDAYDKESNPNGNFPRPLTTWSQNDSGAFPSSFWIVNASYVRLKNMQFGYTIPANVCKFIGISKAKLYYSGQNLLTFTGLRKGFDPEAPAGARAYYPQVKTSTIGLNVTF
jgi:TonB-linked SusC/RagA family outer membrane protein